jgi:hypothetical protein
MSNPYVPIAAGVGTTVVSGSPCGLKRVEVIGPVGTGTVTLYDNNSTPSGNVLLTVPASAPIGAVYELDMTATTGIVAAGSTGSPAVNVTIELD